MKVKLTIVISLIWNVLLCATSFAQTSSNNSALFNGSFDNGSRIRVVDGSPVDQTANQKAYQITGTAISLEAWIYPVGFPKNTGQYDIIERSLNGDPYFSYALFVTYYNGYPQAAFGISDGTAGSVQTIADPDTLKPYAWAHVAGTYDGTYIRIYVNGVLKAKKATSITISSSGIGLYIGRFTTDRFEGLIDDVSLWNTTRSATQIAGDMKNGLSGTETGLAGYWKMDSYSTINNSSVVMDETSNHNNLVVQNNTPIVPFNHLSQSGTPTYSFTPSSYDFGTIEEASLAADSLAFTNTSNYPLFGNLESNNANVFVDQGIIYIPPNSTHYVNTWLVPFMGGNISDTLRMNTNTGDTTAIPYTINSISLRRFNGNNISMWLQRDGRFARNPLTGNAGFEWPANSGKTAVFASGIWIGAKVSGKVRTAAAVYGTEFSPGPIVNGAPADPNNVAYRVYKIQPSDTNGSNPDYTNWPAKLGAPVNPDGSPKVIGDQTLFTVYNDMDPSRHLFGSAPLGAEVQQTTFGYNKPGPLSNTVFLRFKIINESNTRWDSTFVSLWSDPDLGGPYDDLVGIDTARNMGFVYNGSNNDAVYGTSPPALGYKILRGAYFTKPIQAFAYYTNGAKYPYTDPANAQEAHNYMQGRLQDGSPFINPQTQNPTPFALSGDPVTNTGWLDSSPDDRRFLFSTGPFSLDPGQSKEMIAAIIVGKGTSNINSITVLRQEADSIQSLYDQGKIFGGALENVTAAKAAPNSSDSLNDLKNASTTINFNSGSTGATVEVGTYSGPPPGTQDISTPSVSGVGKYMDIQTSGSVNWPVNIKVYYTANDLAQAGVSENDLKGLYYWDATNNMWNLYSNSGADDQGRGVSTTSVDTTNITVNGIHYEGYVAAVAYHLTPIKIGASPKTSTAIQENNQIVRKYSLSQNYPNPFNPTTTIRFSIAKQGFVSLKVYNLLGQLVATLVNRRMAAGRYVTNWDASHLASGVYIYRLHAGNFIVTKKLILMK